MRVAGTTGAFVASRGRRRYCNCRAREDAGSSAIVGPHASSDSLSGGCDISLFAASALDACRKICKLRFSGMATQSNPLQEPQRDFEFPQREAAFFYGLFLRGHSAEELRRDIEVSPAVLAKWDRETEREPGLRFLLEQVVRYRQHVLAIFENLVGHDSATQRLQ